MYQNIQKKNLIITTILTFIILFLIAYFFFGFYSLENSSGAGGFDGDLASIWSNLQIFKTGVIENLDNRNYNDSRIPLSYILHIKLNPFSNSISGLRNSVFLISLLVPILFYISIKKKYENLNNLFLICISLIITLSPYFRTSSYWALGENYAFIFILVSFLLLNMIENEKKDQTKNLSILFLLTLSSSIVVYFDQKLAIIPLVVYLQILVSNQSLKYKILTTFFYILFSLPFFYLIFLWESILPPNAHALRLQDQNNEIYHIGYTSSMIAFYLFPLIFFKENWKYSLTKKIFNKNFVSLLFFILIYLLLIIFFGNFNELPNLGKGVLHKGLSVIFVNDNIKFILTLFGFLVSFLIIYIYLDFKYDFIFIFYFLIISFFIYPFLQEYIDPIFFLLLFTFFKTKIVINFKNILIIFIYYFSFLTIAQVYY